MGVKLTNHITHGARRLFVLGCGFQAQLTHGVDNASLYRLQPITYMGQCPVQYHVHGVVQVGLLCILAERSALNPLVIKSDDIVHRFSCIGINL